MKGLLRDKKACEYVLLDTPIKNRITRAFTFLKEKNFIKEFENNTENASRIQALIGYYVDYTDILEKDIFKKIVYKDNILHSLLTYNVSILYLLEQYQEKFKSITTFLCGKKIQKLWLIKATNRHFDFDCQKDKI